MSMMPEDDHRRIPAAWATASVARHHLRTWFAQPLGRALIEDETRALDAVWPGIFCSSVLQLGRLGDGRLIEQCLAPARLVLDADYDPMVPVSQLRADPALLPFGTRSLSVTLLPHLLEFSPDPHQVLREVERVLMPEGHVVILGFNPLGLWGIKALMRRHREQPPWNGHFLHLARIKDWLRLLGFDITHGRMLFYRPPIESERLLMRLKWLEHVGDRWWPMGAGAYLLVARKRVPGMMPIRPRWHQQRVSGMVVARPAARVIQLRPHA